MKSSEKNNEDLEWVNNEIIQNGYMMKLYKHVLIFIHMGFIPRLMIR